MYIENNAGGPKTYAFVDCKLLYGYEQCAV